MALVILHDAHTSDLREGDVVVVNDEGRTFHHYDLSPDAPGQYGTVYWTDGGTGTAQPWNTWPVVVRQA